MQINRVTILFVIYKSRQRKDKTSPIYCRITYKKSRKEFTTGYHITPENWDSKKQIVKPEEEQHNFINTQLSLIITKVNQAFLLLQVNQVNFGVEEIHRQYRGENIKVEVGLCEVYDLFLKYLEKLIGKELNQDTYKKYVAYGKHLQSFVKWKYKTKDVKITSIKSSFIDQYEYYLKTEKNFAQITLNKVIQRFRRCVKFAIAEEYLSKDPFLLYRAKRVKKEVVFLSQSELIKLENHTFKIQRVQQIKDMFVFCCYSGLAFKEMSTLRKKDIVIGFDAKLWIKIHRSKTSRSYSVPLLPKAKIIVDKYSQSKTEYVFPRISNPKFNAYLKEIADIIGIKINLTHHVARKTFASTVLLLNNVPMEVVSKLLGHSKMQTTQEHYGEIVQKQISEEIMKLNNKLVKK
ncbi:site-specific integrase [Tamlana sp. 62-3]|uniref:Site-specific integrase n=1 Tax=Neotamlana sargassicola TaxID=2883125 RepID=A0A9X1I648_9FLAO|nr:site-specific integrase [Tamlana sargassicola]MCB4807535.1 site-specific integrase [Tamlana sargassicola]